MAAVTIHKDFGSQEYEICHCFHVLHIYLQNLKIQAKISIVGMASFTGFILSNLNQTVVLNEELFHRLYISLRFNSSSTYYAK